MYNIGTLSNGWLAISYSTVFKSVCGSRYHMLSYAGVIGEKQKCCFPKSTCIRGSEQFLYRCFCAAERSPWTQLVAYSSFLPAGRDILHPIVTRPRGENLDQSRKLEKHAGDAKIVQRPKPLSLLQRH